MDRSSLLASIPLFESLAEDDLTADHANRPDQGVELSPDGVGAARVSRAVFSG